MFQALFNIIINLLATLIQIVCLPLNLAIESGLPDVSSQITQVTETFSTVFNNISWAIGLIPRGVADTLLFILTVEIAKHTIYISTNTLIKVWNLFQKLKFW